jgi:hypothetical protein
VRLQLRDTPHLRGVAHRDHLARDVGAARRACLRTPPSRPDRFRYLWIAGSSGQVAPEGGRPPEGLPLSSTGPFDRTYSQVRRHLGVGFAHWRQEHDVCPTRQLHTDRPRTHHPSKEFLPLCSPRNLPKQSLGVSLAARLRLRQETAVSVSLTVTRHVKRDKFFISSSYPVQVLGTGTLAFWLEAGQAVCLTFRLEYWNVNITNDRSF